MYSPPFCEVIIPKYAKQRNIKTKIRVGGEEVERELSERDLHCMARLLQSALFAPKGENIFYGCRFCKFSSECRKALIKHEKMGVDYLRVKLRELTAVDLDMLYKDDKFK